MTRELTIAPQAEGKGRAFRALCLATVEADQLWPGGSTATEDMRPVWAMFAGTDQELRPFMANLTLGKKADFPSTGYSRRMALLKSAGYQLTWQREAEGSIVTAFLPSLFQLDPGMVDPAGASFVVLPPAAWLTRQSIEPEPIVAHAERLGYPLERAELEELVPLAFLFTAYLDRRTRCPIVSDGRFYLQLMLAALKHGAASWSTGTTSHEFGHGRALMYAEGTQDCGIGRGVAFHADHPAVEALLAEQVDIFFEATR